MQIIDGHGRIVRSPDTVAVLVDRLDRAVGPALGEIAVAEQVWSSSGALHLSGIWRPSATPVAIKLGVNANQLYWTQQIAKTPGFVPMLYASGDHLGNVAVGWTVMERVAFGSLGPDWHGAEFEMLLEAAVRFQHATRTITPRHTETMDAAMLRRRLEVGIRAEPPGPVDRVMQRLDRDFAWVAAICESEICHGDVHMCNVLTRTAPPERSAALLIDCQPIRQPWAFDAAYPQVLNSIDRGRVGYQELVPKMARLRTTYGMSSCSGRDLQQLEHITLAWFALRLWGLTPERHTIQDYRDATQRYITASAELPS